MKERKENSMALSRLKVVKDEREEIAAEVFEGAIVEIGVAMKAIAATRLSRAAIVALIKDRTHLTKATICLVLDNLDDLEKNWLRPKVRK
jgi:uncharacterized UPF0146 family protein